MRSHSFYFFFSLQAAMMDLQHSPSGTLEKDLFAGVVTDLCFLSNQLLLVGHGPYLKIFDITTNKQLAIKELLPNNRIHRIILHPLGPDDNETTRHFLAYGSKFATIAKVVMEQDGHIRSVAHSLFLPLRPTLTSFFLWPWICSIQTVASFGPFCDWIMDMAWLSSKVFGK
ncbi:hypothetical protein DM01DRAFT_64523 [Hesseltinella vesiculosa]|uniref:CNH domain-containing protein n=1 Tax=Hesseltinella vesiculosa TaxID=101127 RepID=A0A1X2GW69_9FUNG|nr:hypothetical protein DM01DRAFT_64523 [Hesseltinella vesiculosa]